MADKPNTYIRLYFSNLAQLERLSYEQVGRLTIGIMRLKARGEPPDFSDDRLLSVVAEGIIGRIDEDYAAYERKCAVNRENGAKGGAPKGNTNASKTTETTDRLKTTLNKKEKKKESNKENNTIHTSTVADGERMNYQAVVSSFNQICVSLSKVQKLTDTRKRHIKSAVKTLGSMSFEEYFHMVEASDFLTGRKGDWKASFDWILSPANMVKVIEGNYRNSGSHNRNKSVGGPNTEPSSAQREQEELLRQFFGNDYAAGEVL
ncbi:DUF6291 domain-containing protein [Ruminococcus sp.]|uniref:DUF6291 domain-containing protein n=1 Tax=Ruminococcus sp. TaxID=41978 RepID=UPI00388D3AC2